MAATKTVRIPWSLGEHQDLVYTQREDGSWVSAPHTWAWYGRAFGHSYLVPEFKISEDDFESDYVVTDLYEGIWTHVITRSLLSELFAQKLFGRDGIQLPEEFCGLSSEYAITEGGIRSVLRKR